MLIRPARASDADALAGYEYPGHEPWIDEVVEIVHGLLAWRDSTLADDFDRQVLVLEDDDGGVVGVCAHEATDNGQRVFVAHRYLMVTAVWPGFERRGVARSLVTSVVADLQRSGAQSVTWLVHPRNHPSIVFSRQVFPEAEETYPPHDAPYVAFTLTLD